MISSLNGAIGIVHSIDTENYTAKVQLLEYENQITEDLQILSPITFGNKLTAIPKINTPVFCIFLGDNTGNGFIIGSYFSDKNKSSSKEDEIKLDFQGASLTVKEDGNIELKGTLTKIDSDVQITGNTIIEKNLNTGGAVSASKGFETEKASIKSGKLDVEFIDYKEMKKK